MGNLSITSKKITENYTFEGEGITIKGVAQMDEQSHELLTNACSCFSVDGDKQVKELVGTFNGTVKGGELVYTYSDMPRKFMMAVMDALDEIEIKLNN